MNTIQSATDTIYLLLACSLVFLASALITYVFRSRSFYKSAYAKHTGASYFKTINNPGSLGEYKLGLQLERFDPSGKMLFNVYIPKANGTTSEIDALLVSTRGIFVFENKNYSGWIFGRAEDKAWTQTLNRHSKFHFANPIRQNAGHVKALKDYLRLPESCFEPIVVFADKTTLKKVDKGNAIVLHTSQVASAMNQLASGRLSVLSEDQVAKQYERLKECSNVSEEVKQRHIKQIKSRHK